MFNKKKKNNKGFTLVELLVVIAIIGILAAVAVPSLFKNLEKAKVAEATSYISAAKSSMMSTYADNPSVADGATLTIEVEGGKPDTLTSVTGSKTSSGLQLSVTFEANKLSADGIAKVKANFAGDNNITYTN